jgi:hypothetical protein
MRKVAGDIYVIVVKYIQQIHSSIAQNYSCLYPKILRVRFERTSSNQDRLGAMKIMKIILVFVVVLPGLITHYVGCRSTEAVFVEKSAEMGPYAGAELYHALSHSCLRSPPLHPNYKGKGGGVGKVFPIAYFLFL